MSHDARHSLKFLSALQSLWVPVISGLRIVFMSVGEAVGGAAEEETASCAGSSHVTAKASPKRTKLVRPKIDLDEEIRRANDLAAMSRKMLQAARNVSRNNRKAKQRLIKKAGKLSPEDLERIAVLKRCGLYEEDAEEGEEDNESGEEGSRTSEKRRLPGPSLAESKRPKMSKALETLTASNPILAEIGVGSAVASTSSTAASSSSTQSSLAQKKKGVVVLGTASRLARAPSAPRFVGDSRSDEVSQ